MNFFKWLKWVFSKQLSIKVDSCVFDNVTEDSYYQKNGVFYEYNVQHTITNCTFNPYKEPEPFMVDVKIDMGDPNENWFNQYYTGSLEVINTDNDEPIIIPSTGVMPFDIVISPEKPLTEAERLDRFCDAIWDWNKRMERYEIENMKVDTELCQGN